MKTISIKKEIGTTEAILGTFGVQVAKTITQQLKKHEPIAISFKGLKNVNINFTCSMIQPLYKSFPKKTIEKLVTYQDVTDKFWQSEIEEAISLATNPKKAKIIEEVRNKVFWGH
ncbi:MAG: hypothetical protein HY841_07065 [Bacteroidetes bacterium]|nr:hypothetical protein [Bacteroidota bacterium]